MTAGIAISTISQIFRRIDSAKLTDEIAQRAEC